MTTKNTRWSGLRPLLGAALSLALMTQMPLATAATFHPDGQGDANLELDANILNAGVTDEEAFPGDDWETVYKTVESIMPRQTLNANNIAYMWKADQAPLSIFTGGGSKDLNDISMWRHKDGSVPDKDDITHAMAAAYDVSNELVLYLGADRYSNDGNAEMGAWFFQDEVVANPDGTFTGHHRNGDILWIGEFTVGGQVATLKVLLWNDPDLAGYRSELAQVKNTKLALLIEGTGGDFYSARVNDQPTTPTVWPYTPKQGTAGTFPVSSFMEGGINLSGLLGGEVPCFSSFLMETRSSSEVNAQLKDFVLGSLNTCRIEVRKSCPSSSLDATATGIDHNYEVYVKNSGFGTITSVTLRDNNATPSDTTDDMTHTYTGDITSGQEVKVWEFTTNSTQNPPTNTVYATGHIGTISTAEVSAQATCPIVQLSPKIDVTKGCTTKVVAQGSNVVVQVGFSGQVCNTDLYDADTCPTCTNTKLKSVTVTDSDIGSLLIDLDGPGGNPPSSSVSLNPGQCGTFAGTYYPDAVVGGGDPAVQEYTDTVTAAGQEQISNAPVSDTATATCKLCPTCPTCEPVTP